MKLSANFSLSEFVKPGVEPTVPQLNNLFRLATELEIVRRILGDFPIFVHSGLRTPERNAQVGGVSGSHHLSGEACDFHVVGHTVMHVWSELLGRKDWLHIDQLIRYKTHLHLSVHPTLRREFFAA